MDSAKKYQTTKEQCESRIRGVCEGCGGKLEALETEDNSGNPTYWQGCNHCSSFRSGVDAVCWKIARELVESGEMLPYSHMHKGDYLRSPEKLDYFYDSQTAGLSNQIARIEKLLAEGRKRI